MKRFVLMLCILFPVLGQTEATQVTCGILNGNPRSQLQTFDEGVDDYLVTLHAQNANDSVFTAFVKADYKAYKLELRIPKLVGTPDVQPACFLETKHPLLFTCEKGAVHPKALLTSMITGDVREVPVSRFTISAKTKRNHTMRFDGQDSRSIYNIWSVSLESDGKTYQQKFVFGSDQCVPELR